ncbi:hypothetical protein MHYP_G00032860 [Metynnis hypsauchen]
MFENSRQSEFYYLDEVKVQTALSDVAVRIGHKQEGRDCIAEAKAKEARPSLSQSGDGDHRFRKKRYPAFSLEDRTTDDIVMLSSDRRWSTAGVSVVTEMAFVDPSPVMTSLPPSRRPPLWRL